MATSSAMSTSNQYIKYTIAITQNSQNITTNSSSVTVKVRFYRTNTGYETYGTGTVYCKINGTTYSASVTSSQKITNSGIVLFSKTLNISHNANGTKTLTCSAWIDHQRVTSSEQSYSQTLTTIPRASSLTVGNGTLGTALTLTINRHSSSFTHTITYTCFNSSGTVVTKTSNTSISWTPPLSLASENTSGTSVTIGFTIKTFNGSTQIGSASKFISCTIPSSVKPSCSVTLSDTTTYYSTYGGYIKGLSKLSVKVTPTTSYGSAISSYRTTANGNTYTAASFTTDVLKTSGTLTVSAKVTDKRGRSGTASKSITVLDYSPPKISLLKVKRCKSLTDGTEDINGEFAQVTFSGSITDLGANASTYILEYKKASETNYTSVVLNDYLGTKSVTEGYYRFPAESGSTYNIRLTLADNIQDDKLTTGLSTAVVLQHFGADGFSMGLGKLAELYGVLDIGFKTRFYGGILPMMLEPETDLNNVLDPNFYVGANVSTYNYKNCPLESGTFDLEVQAMGADGQRKQIITYCHKTEKRTLERIYYSQSWGEWVCTSDFGGTLLWEGVSYMVETHTADLSEAISKQRLGIVLVFSRYSNGAAQDINFSCHFVPKMAVNKHEGCGFTFMMSEITGTYVAMKYLYIHDTKIVGNANNDLIATVGNIPVNNNSTVLRYVIGV